MMRVLIILAVGVGLWWWWAVNHRESTAVAADVSAAKTTGVSMPASAPAQAAGSTVGMSLPAKAVPQQPLQVTADDLVIVRGTVDGENDGMLVVHCREDRNIGQGFAWNVDAGSGAAASAQLAKMAVGYRNETITKEFGTLQRIPTGYSRDLDERTDRVIGRLMLHGYRPTNDKVYVVAADTGATYDGLPLYTLNYKVRSSKSTQPPSSVTWSPFPPGVDTPEQKREYLQQLAEEKRLKAAGKQ